MRLSEKTIELNICSQISRACHPNLTWFGLTQKQEARAGFDACTRIRGKLLVLQFKASNHTVSGARRFKLKHRQLVRLSSLCRSYSRSVFYAFPLIGNTHELANTSNFLAHTWLLDVANVIGIPAPTKINGALRKSGIHYADVVPGSVTLRSDPYEIPLLPLDEIVESQFEGAEGLQSALDDLQFTSSLLQLVSKPSSGMILHPPNAKSEGQVRRIR